MRKILFLLIFLLLSIAATQAQVSTDQYNPLQIEHDGIDRLAHVYQPQGEIHAAMIALHPYYSSGRAMEALTGFNTIADERGWLMVYPESLESYWDDGRISAGLPPVNATIDDVGYLANLADTIRETYEIETVYLSGLALGGTMALRAVCETPEKYDGVAIVNALMWSYQEQYCAANENPAIMDMLFIKGSHDHIYWTEGRTINNAQWTILGALDTVNIWSGRNHCENFVPTEVRRSALAVSVNCDEETTIAYLPVINSGNNWSKSGENSLNNRGIDTAEVIAAFLADDDNWQELTVQEEISEDIDRSYVVYVPTSYDPSTPTPVVLSLHGRGANNFSQAFSTGFNQVAEEEGFIVVYPQAYDPNFNNPQLADATWNYNLNTPLMAEDLTHDDDAFLDDIVDDIALSLNVDMNRLYVNGLSNGGYMTNRLACTRGNRYAAFAAVAANAPFGLGGLCEDGVHAPIMFYHGTADTISPWDGATLSTDSGEQFYLLAPLPNTLAFWVTQNGCEGNYEQTALPGTDPDSRVVFARYTDCPGDSAVEIYAVVGGGHLWHGVQDVDNQFLGEDNMDINASEAIWAFYSQYTLDGRDETVDAFVSGDPDNTGYGVPQFPMTLAEIQVETQTEASPESQAVTALQSGGYTILFALDLTTDFDCESDSLDDTILTQMENNQDAFNRIGVTIGIVTTVDDCRANQAGTAFTDNTLTFSVDELPFVFAIPPDAGTVNIIIGDAAQISAELGFDVAPGQSVLVQATGESFTPLAVVPENGWTTLADNYETN